MQDLVFIPGPFHKESLQILLLLSQAGGIGRDMGWIIVDTNQASRAKASLIDSLQAEGIIIPPFVLGELWNSSDRRPLEKLADYPLRLGMTPGEVMARLTKLRLSQIMVFQPFHNLSSREVQHGLLNQSPQRMQEFVKETIPHIRAAKDVFSSARARFRNSLRSQGYDPRDFKFTDFNSVLDMATATSDNFIMWLLIEIVSECGTKTTRANCHALYAGAMKNPYLRRFFYSLLWYIVSSQQAWTREYDKWNISVKHNDWTDITLPLYAAPDDIYVRRQKRA